MGFAGASCTFTRYRIVERIPADFRLQIPERLRRRAFQDIDAFPDQERAWGWTSFDDMLDTEWNGAPPEKGAYLTFALRLETRRIPPSVIKKHLAVALRAEKQRIAEQGKNFISRERKKEIKEQLLLRLNKHFLPVPSLFDVIWATDSDMLFFASTQRKLLDLFEEYFTQSFELSLEQLTPYGLAATILNEHELDAVALLEATNFA